MQRIHEDSLLTKGEYWFLSFYLVIMTIEIGIEYYSAKSITWALLMFRTLSLLTPLFAGEMVLRHRLWDKTYRTTICLFFLFILIWSIPVYFEQGENVSIFSATIYFAIPLGVSLENVDTKFFRKPFFIICLIGIVCFFYFWFTYDIDISKAVQRRYTWTDIFFWAGVFWAIIPITLYSFVSNISWKYKVFVIGYWICGIIFYLIFLKRFILVDSVLLILMICFFYFSEDKLNIKLFFVGAFVFTVLFLVGSFAKDSAIGLLWNGVMGRFADTSVNEFDRFEETRIYFSNTNIIYTILGKGLWGGHSSLAGLHEALHVGWANLIHKGGIILFVLVLYPTIKAFYLLPKMKTLDKKTKWAVCMACIYAIRLTYSNMHAHYPEMVMAFFSYAIIANYSLPSERRQYRYIK